MLNKLKELRESREEGFTLIELLVVIVIIGVLAAIALPIFLNQQKAAVAAAVKSDVRNTVTSVSTYLVKAPTATDIAGANTKGVLTGSATATAPATPKVPIAISDTNTTITVTGQWDTYVISGSNTSINNGFFVFDSKTGKYGSSTVATGITPGGAY